MEERIELENCNFPLNKWKCLHSFKGKTKAQINLKKLDVISINIYNYSSTKNLRVSDKSDKTQNCYGSIDRHSF